MEEHRFSSSSDEFDFGTLDNELTYISDESSGEDSEATRGVKRRFTESDNEPGSEALEGPSQSTWELIYDHNELPPIAPFIPGQTLTTTRIPSDTEQPVDFFKLFVTTDLAKKIIEETNLYAKRKLEGKTLSAGSVWRSWRDVTMEEFWAFLAVVINMGTMPLASLQEYWSRSAVSHIPFYADTFTRDRFSQIFWMLHLETTPKSDSNPRTRLQRVSRFLDYISSKFLEYFIPGEHICVAESAIKLKGRISFVTRNPKKPTKRCVRVYALADSTTGYVCCILPCYGSLTTELLVRPDLPASARIPIQLYQTLLEKIPGAQGHHMYTDRCYTSYVLAQELSKLKCHLTGTIFTSRKELPKGIKKANLWKKGTVAYRRGKTLVVGWKDKRVVTCLTTRGDTGTTPVRRTSRGGVDVVVKKPNVVLNYEKHMGGVDRADQCSSTYCFLRKSLKWWRKLFFLGLEMSLVNSYILYKQEKTKKGVKPASRLRYVKTLVSQLRGPYRQQREQASTPCSDGVRLDGKLHVMVKGPKRDCRVCSDRSTPGGRREVTYYCDTCPDKPRMHLGECFVKYHTKANYRA